MVEEALEDKMHALIQSKVPVFLPAGIIEYMTARDDWDDVCPPFVGKVDDDIRARVGARAGSHSGEGFIARKNGVLGNWIEKEYMTATSDVTDEILDVFPSMDEVPSSETVIAQAAFAAIELNSRFPEAQFYVIEGRDTWSTGGGRVCLSVFIPEDASNKDAIIEAYYRAELPKLDPGIVKQVFGDRLDELSAYFVSKKPKDFGIAPR